MNHDEIYFVFAAMSAFGLMFTTHKPLAGITLYAAFCGDRI